MAQPQMGFYVQRTHMPLPHHVQRDTDPPFESAHAFALLGPKQNAFSDEVLLISTGTSALHAAISAD